MLQPKDTDWLNGYKHKTTIYAVYKRPTSDLGTHTDRKWENGKRYSMQSEIKSFSDKQKLREFSPTKPALQQMLKGLI